MLQEACFQRAVVRALKSSDAHTTRLLQQYAQWQWVDADGTKHDYPAEFNSLLEKAYVRFQEDMAKRVSGDASTGAAGAGAGNSSPLSSVVLALRPHRVVSLIRMREVGTGHRRKVIRTVRMEYVIGVDATGVHVGSACHLGLIHTPIYHTCFRYPFPLHWPRHTANFQCEPVQPGCQEWDHVAQQLVASLPAAKIVSLGRCVQVCCVCVCVCVCVV